MAAEPVTLRVWHHPIVGGAIRAVGALAGLYIALHLLLRHNSPPQGIYVYGAFIGMLYSLLAFGLILIYRANRIINFAQAEIGATTAVLAVLLIKVHHVPYLVALLIAIGAGIVAGMVIEVTIVRRFANSSRLVLSVATIGVSLVFAALQLYLPKWLGGSFIIDPAPPKTPLSSLHMAVGSYRFDANAVIIGVWALAVVIALTLFFRWTDTGIAARAAAENANRAALLGVPVKRVSTVVWMIAGGLSALSVFLRVPVIGIPIGIFIGPVILLYGLAAAVIARMESFGTALVAGISLGVLEQALYYFSRDPTISGAVILPILLVAMLVQRNQLSRGQDTGASTWSLARDYRPIPPELSRLPEVAWARIGLAVVAVGMLLGGYELLPLKQQVLSSVVVIYGIVVVSMVILTGWAGQISLGHWGIAGIGAAVAGNLVARHHADFFVTLIAAGLVGAVASVVIGLPALRISGLYLAVTTLAFGITVQAYFLSRSYFRGFLPTITQQVLRPVLYSRYSLVGDRAFYYCCLVILGLCLLSARMVRRSRTGRVIVAIRDNQKGAQAFGVSASVAKLWAFALSGFWAAVAGALYAYQQGAVNPEGFPPEFSLTLLIVLVIGGVTSLPGAILATGLLGVIQYGDLSQALSLAGLGLIALVLLYFVPGGLAQLFYGARDSGLRWLADRRHVAVPSLTSDGRQPTMPDVSPVATKALAFGGD